MEASADLGASGFQTFRHVMLPSVGTALLAGSMLAARCRSTRSSSPRSPPAASRRSRSGSSAASTDREPAVLNVVAIVVMAATMIPVMIAQRIAGKEATNRL